MNRREVRELIFKRIAAEAQELAEKRSARVADVNVLGLEFGKRPSQPHFGAGGELRFDIGWFRNGRWRRFGAPLEYPIDVPRFEFDFNAWRDFGWGSWPSFYAHYTPITRRIDRIRVVYVSWRQDRTYSEANMRVYSQVLARQIAKKFHPADIRTVGRWDRFVFNHQLTTEITCSALERIGREEAAAVDEILSQIPAISEKGGAA